MTIDERYVRNMQSLTEQECASLALARVCVVGLGGLGGYCLDQLARIGVGHLVGIDFDAVEPSNLNRQLFATEATLGMRKVDAAAARLGDVNSRVDFCGLDVALSRENAADLIAGCDCVIDALDNREARFWLAHACQEAGVPLVYGAIAGWYGQVCTVLPGDPSFVNIYGSTEGEGIERQEGNLPFTAAAVASFQSAEAIKVLIGREDILQNRLLMIDMLFGSCEEMVLR